MQRVELTLDRMQQLRDLHEEIRRDVDELIALQIRVGSKLCELHGSGGYVALGVTSFATYCNEKLPLGPKDGYRLLGLGKVLSVSSDMEQQLLQGRTTVTKAVAMGRILCSAEMQRTSDTWSAWAEWDSEKRFLDRISERVAEVRHKGFVVPFKAWLSPEGMSNFLRARKVTSQKAGKDLDEGETLEVVVDDYLNRHDPLRKAERFREKDHGAAEGNGSGHGDGPLEGSGAWRVVEGGAEGARVELEGGAGAEGEGAGSASATPRPSSKPSASSPASSSPSSSASSPASSSAPSPAAALDAVPGAGASAVKLLGQRRRPRRAPRRLPAPAQREVLRRMGEGCFVQGCDSPGPLEGAHVVPYRLGGGPLEWTQRFRLCRLHHRQMDAGVWKARQGSAGVVMVDVRGSVVGRFRGPDSS
jgi:hypothetical protein